MPYLVVLAELNRTTKVFRNGAGMAYWQDLMSGRDVAIPAPRFVRPLMTAEVIALQEHYRITTDADERSRCQMILFSARGKSIAEIAELTLFTDDTVL
jgi:hypothetical protein